MFPLKVKLQKKEILLPAQCNGYFLMIFSFFICPFLKNIPFIFNVIIIYHISPFPFLTPSPTIYLYVHVHADGDTAFVGVGKK